MKVLVAGIGNIFLGDDGFGVEVVRRLARRPLPDGVRVIDFGIRGFDLAQALLSGYDAAIIIDATPRGGPPGSLYVLEPDLDGPAYSEPQDCITDAHALGPVTVFRLAKALGGRLPRLRLVGCEPATTEADNPMELSEPVRAAVDPAVAMIEALLAEILGPAPEPGRA